MADIVVPAGTKFVRGIAVGVLGVYAKSGTAPLPPDVPTNARLLENGNPRFTESGDFRILEA